MTRIVGTFARHAINSAFVATCLKTTIFCIDARRRLPRAVLINQLQRSWGAEKSARSYLGIVRERSYWLLHNMYGWLTLG